MRRSRLRRDSGGPPLESDELVRTGIMERGNRFRQPSRCISLAGLPGKDNGCPSRRCIDGVPPDPRAAGVEGAGRVIGSRGRGALVRRSPTRSLTDSTAVPVGTRGAPRWVDPAASAGMDTAHLPTVAWSVPGAWRSAKPGGGYPDDLHRPRVMSLPRSRPSRTPSRSKSPGQSTSRYSPERSTCVSRSPAFMMRSPTGCDEQGWIVRRWRTERARFALPGSAFFESMSEDPGRPPGQWLPC